MAELASMHASTHDPHDSAYVKRNRCRQDELLRELESDPENTQDPALSDGISAIADGRLNEGMLDTISAFPGLLPRFRESGSQVIVFKVVAPYRLFSQNTNLIHEALSLKRTSITSDDQHTYIWRRDREVLRINWQNMTEIVKILQWLCSRYAREGAVTNKRELCHKKRARRRTLQLLSYRQ